MHAPASRISRVRDSTVVRRACWVCTRPSWSVQDLVTNTKPEPTATTTTDAMENATSISTRVNPEVRRLLERAEDRRRRITLASKPGARHGHGLQSDLRGVRRYHGGHRVGGGPHQLRGGVRPRGQGVEIDVAILLDRLRRHPGAIALLPGERHLTRRHHDQLRGRDQTGRQKKRCDDHLNNGEPTRRTRNRHRLPHTLDLDPPLAPRSLRSIYVCPVCPAFSGRQPCQGPLAQAQDGVAWRRPGRVDLTGFLQDRSWNLTRPYGWSTIPTAFTVTVLVQLRAVSVRVKTSGGDVETSSPRVSNSAVRPRVAPANVILGRSVIVSAVTQAVPFY